MEFLAAFHPKLVHFPIALLLTYTLLEAVGAILKKDFFSKAAYILLILGVLGAVAAAQTGEQAELLFENWTKASGDLLESHEKYANLTVWLFSVLLVIRTAFTILVQLKKKYTVNQTVLKYIFVLIAIIGCYFIYETGEYGGKMVYEHGVGTKPMMESIEE
ncbi:MAG: hypothetical protein Q8N03_14880 [Ignavibacteria bacterium]|nr:hypothetical protein [Ignavibacteria bacterium]